MDTTLKTKKAHHGYNVKRLREILGVKQEDLAERMELQQQTISKLENKDTLDNEVIEKIADALHVPADAIKNFSDEAAINIIANTFTNNASVSAITNYPIFNPIEKIVELYNEKVELYERMLKSEQEKVTLLEGLLKSKIKEKGAID